MGQDLRLRRQEPLMHFGITMIPSDLAVSPVRLGMLVEEFGFESIWLGEHSHIPVSRDSAYPSGGALPDDFLRFHDTMISLAAIASVTSHIRLGMSTLVVPDHDPIVLAKQISSLDHFSHGRVIVGVGAGWNLEEIANHGVDPKYRVSIMCERVEAMKAIWTNEEASYHGRFVDFDPIWQWPKPVQRPYPPILFGGQGERVLERVLDHGTGWLVSGRHFDEHRVVEWDAKLQAMAADRGRGHVPVSFQDGPARADAIETCIATGLERYVLRVPAADEATVVAALEEHARLVAPYR
jgi:probable F420-dependent oxidoreductase